MKYVVMVTRQGMGSAEKALSDVLIKNYINLISDEPQKPSAILFYAEGVKLLKEDSPIYKELKKAELSGIKLIACKTCLSYYKILGKQCVGMAGTMQDIISYQVEADKVITV